MNKITDIELYRARMQLENKEPVTTLELAAKLQALCMCKMLEHMEEISSSLAFISEAVERLDRSTQPLEEQEEHEWS